MNGEKPKGIKMIRRRNIIMENKMKKKKLTVLSLLFLFLILPLSSALTVTKIIDHQVSFSPKENQISHTLRTYDYGINNITITDYLPEELNPESSELVFWKGKKVRKVVLTISEIKANQTKTLTYKLFPKSEKNYTIYSKLEYHLYGEKHTKTSINKEIEITHKEGQTSNGKSFINKEKIHYLWITILLIIILLGVIKWKR